jgi:hypothetical protein
MAGVVDCWPMDQNSKDILEAVTFIKDRMLSKDDVRDIAREELTEYATKKDMRQIMEEVVDEKLRPPNRCALLLAFAAFSEQATEAAIERLAGALRRHSTKPIGGKP